MSLATGRSSRGSPILISFIFCAFSCGPLRQVKCLPLPPGGRGSLNSCVYHVCFWDPVKMLFWLHLWSHWASIVLKLTLKRRHFQVPELHGVLAGNCTPASTRAPFSLFLEVLKSPLFAHFSKSILWRFNLNPFGLITTGI